MTAHRESPWGFPLFLLASVVGSLIYVVLP